MGGEDKGLIELNGRPLLDYIISGLRPQVGTIMVNANRNLARYREFGYPVVEDILGDYFGPLVGMATGMQSAATPLLVSVPCDSPFIPAGLVETLYRAMGESGAEISVAHDGSRLQPVYALLRCQLLPDLLAYLNANFTPDDRLLVIGDMNIAPLDLDIGIGPDNAKRWLRTGKCSFLPEEREWMRQLTGWGLCDTFRQCHPEVDDRFSWFDYRSRGFEREPKRGLRIDLVLASPALGAQLSDAGIAYDIRAMEKPSDHCPVWASFDL